MKQLDTFLNYFKKKPFSYFSSTMFTCLRKYTTTGSQFLLEMPALSPTMVSGNIGAWSKKPGDKINEGDLLVEIETDKAVMDLEAQEDGYLEKILKQTGERDVPIQTPIAVLNSEKPLLKNQIPIEKKSKHKDRSVVARITTEAKKAPHFYLNTEICVDNVLNVKKKKKEEKYSINDFVVKAAAMATKDVNRVNCYWNGKSLVKKEGVNINIAVAVEDGIFVPLLRNVDSKSVSEISKEIKTIVQRARSGSIGGKDQETGSFSISNLGMFGITQFSAILNPPQSFMLAIGSVVEKVVDICVKDGVVFPVKKNFMTVTLSCDHRALDGKDGAVWLQSFKKHIETLDCLGL